MLGFHLGVLGLGETMTDPNLNNHGGYDSDHGAQNRYESDKTDALMSWESGQDYDSGYDNSYYRDYDEVDSN